jgi:hypothetical protein
MFDCLAHYRFNGGPYLINLVPPPAVAALFYRVVVPVT